MENHARSYRPREVALDYAHLDKLYCVSQKSFLCVVLGSCRSTLWDLWRVEVKHPLYMEGWYRAPWGSLCVLSELCQQTSLVWGSTWAYRSHQISSNSFFKSAAKWICCSMAKIEVGSDKRKTQVPVCPHGFYLPLWILFILLGSNLFLLLSVSSCFLITSLVDIWLFRVQN